MKTISQSLRELALSVVEEEERKREEAELREREELAARIERALRTYFHKLDLPFEFQVQVRPSEPVQVVFAEDLRLLVRMAEVYERLELQYQQVCSSCGRSFYGWVMLGSLADETVSTWPSRENFLLSLGYVIEHVDQDLADHVCQQERSQKDDPIRQQERSQKDDPIRQLADALAEVLRAGGYLPEWRAWQEER